MELSLESFAQMFLACTIGSSAGLLSHLIATQLLKPART
jgi:hypothetical protein